MKAFVRTLAALAFSLSIVAGHVNADPGTPVEQYAALLKEYGPASGALRMAETDLERKVAVENLGAYPSRFLDFAEKYPKDPVALTALRQAIQALGSTDSAAQIVWETNRSDFPAAPRDGSAVRTVSLLMRDHVLSDKIGPVSDRLRYSYRLESEEFLGAVLETNPHREMQGLACFALAQFMHDKLRALRLAEDRPELAECYGIVFGKDYLPALRRLGRADLSKRIETLFERAVSDYKDVKFRSGTIGELAKLELNELRHLSVGKIAPKTEGKDQDGESMKLTDYRGRVVLLYFWSEFCLPCRTTWPHDRSLVTNLRDKPFALIGVNQLFGDSNERKPGELKKFMKQNEITWRTFDEGKGDISRQWNFPGTPTMYIIDHQGTIRYKWVGKAGDKVVDAALEKLIEEAEKAAVPR